MSSENEFFLNEGVTGLQWALGIVGGQVPRLYDGTIFVEVQHTQGGPGRHEN